MQNWCGGKERDGFCRQVNNGKHVVEKKYTAYLLLCSVGAKRKRTDECMNGWKGGKKAQTQIHRRRV